MSKRIKFESICADYSGKSNHVFSMDKDYDTYDCVDTCVIWHKITFCGIPFNLSDDQMNLIYEGDYKDAVKISELLGCMILCKQMLDDGYDPLEICDEVDGDLEYTISALSDVEGPLNTECGDPEQNVLYIHELKMEDGYDTAKLKSRIIKELPSLIHTLFHVVPDILAFYPAPLEFTSDPDKEARYKALQSIAAQKSSIDALLVKDTKKHDKRILKFGDAYQFSKDELNIVMRRRHPDSSYPKEAKDPKEYKFYMANGFKEVGDSRLLYKYVKR